MLEASDLHVAVRREGAGIIAMQRRDDVVVQEHQEVLKQMRERHKSQLKYSRPWPRPPGACIASP